MQGDVLHKQQVQRHIGNAAAGKAHRHHPRIGRRRPHAALEGVAPHGIQHHICAAPAACRLDRLHHVFVRGERMRGARGQRGLALGIRAGAGQHRGAQRRRNLHRRQADARPGSQYQHRIARLHGGAPQQGAPGRSVGNGNGQGGQQRQVVGHGIDGVLGQGQAFGVAAPARQRHHLVARLQASDFRSASNDAAGRFGARHEWQGRPALIAPFDQQLGRVADACDLHGNRDVVGARGRGVRHVSRQDVFNRAVALADQRAHQQPS
ncbi:hypothetical protein D3C85_870090 [compost metagenome]